MPTPSDKNCGVYKITSLINDKIYVGSTSSSFYKRKYGHFYDLRKNIHCNSKLQRAYNKYGKENFKFEILSKCPPEYSLKLEQWFLDNLNPELNILKVAGSAKGFKMSEEAKMRISIANKGKKKPPMSIETRQKLSNSLKGRKLSPEHIQILKNKKGTPLTDFHKSRLVEGHKNRDKDTYKNFSNSYKRLTKEELFLTGQKGGLLVKNRAMSKVILDLETGIFYDSISECANSFNIKISTFKECLRLKRDSRKMNIYKRFIKI